MKPHASESQAIRGVDTVEPFTNYLVLRMQRDFGRAGAGFLATAVARRLDTPGMLESLASRAYVIGGDGHWFLDADREWVITGKIAGSWIQGTTTMITRAQRAAQRYFQRPDAPHVTLDPTRTSLDGFNGRVNLNRNSGLLHVNAALWGVSPGFESNDLGFLGTRRSLRRPRRGDVARRHALALRPRVERVGREMVDVQLRPPAAGRRREHEQLGAVQQLLEHQRRLAGSSVKCSTIG